MKAPHGPTTHSGHIALLRSGVEHNVLNDKTGIYALWASGAFDAPLILTPYGPTTYCGSGCLKSCREERYSHEKKSGGA